MFPLSGSHISKKTRRKEISPETKSRTKTGIHTLADIKRGGSLIENWRGANPIFNIKN